MSSEGMHEIRWHGRGGQGAVTSSKILADAAFRSGWSGVTAAPSFGAERRGAPITASTRMAHETIRILSQVTAPNVVVVLDDSLLAVANAASGMQPGGVMLVNTTQPADSLGLSGDFRVVASDVTGAAEAAGVIVGGQPIVSAAIVGAVAKATALVTLESVEAAIREVFAAAPAAKNVEAARVAYECTSGEASA